MTEEILFIVLFAFTGISTISYLNDSGMSIQKRVMSIAHLILSLVFLYNLERASVRTLAEYSKLEYLTLCAVAASMLIALIIIFRKKKE